MRHSKLWKDRKVFYPHDEAYKAFIASPSGRSAALLLATHKSAFGQRKIIESVAFFCLDEEEDFYSLLFTFQDAEVEDDDTDWEDKDEDDHPGHPTFSISPWPRQTPPPSS
jgi:hypothetical protein